MGKNYVLDTNVLLDNENCIELLKNDENNIFIPATVIEELDRLKKDARKRPQVLRAINSLREHESDVTILYNGSKHETNDNMILKEIQSNEDKVNDPIFITNDKLLQFKSIKSSIKSEPFEYSNPFKSESQRYTGFIHEGELVRNCFYWKDGRMYFYTPDCKEKLVDYENCVWGVKPRSPYQNAALELILNDDIDVVTIQSDAGFGKSFISLAAMMHLTLQKKRFKKMFIFRPNIEIGQELGFLPGDINEKMQPFFRPMKDLLEKLHETRGANRLWVDPDDHNLQLNTRAIEMLPLNFLRGMNIDDAIVLIDECQNISRSELRTILSRMGENVKVICTGDVRQIDNVHLNEDNNGLNWMVKKFKGAGNYGHVVLKGSKSRGPIADLVRNSDL